MPLTLNQSRRRLAAAVLSTLAVVFICGLRSSSAQTTSTKVDQFGNIRTDDAMARLDRFALELQSHPESRGIIVASNALAHNSLRGALLRLAQGYRHYLVYSRAIEPARVSVVEGERKREISFELWTLPANELSSISEEATIAEPASPQPFDEIPLGPEAQCVGELTIELFKLEDGMRILADVLQHHARAKVWVVVHLPARDARATALRLLNKSRQLMVKNGVRSDRILTAVGSPRSSTCGSVNTWIVPGNSTKADEGDYYSELLREAETNGYTVRRVEFSGNERLRDDALRKRFVQQEGDLFSRKLLEQSLQNLDSLGSLYPVTINDVEARIDREEKLIDLTIYFRERRRH